jgi:hypothetical protein
MAAIVAASAAALELVDLFVQAVEFLLGQLAFVLGLLQGGDDAFEVAQNGFEAVPNTIDLAAQHPVNGSVTFVATSAPTTVAISVSVALPATAIVTAIASTVWSTAAIIADALGRTYTIGRAFTIGGGAFFVKFFGFVRFVRNRFRNAFAFRRVVNGRRNIFVFVARTIFTFGVALRKIVFSPWRFVAEPWFSRCITFARGTIVTRISSDRPAAAATTSTTAAARRATASPAATASTAFAKA